MGSGGSSLMVLDTETVRVRGPRGVELRAYVAGRHRLPPRPTHTAHGKRSAVTTTTNDTGPSDDARGDRYRYYTGPVLSFESLGVDFQSGGFQR